jgi:hypothetical protein
MMWNRKQPEQAFPARVRHGCVLGPAEKSGPRTVTAAWPTGLAGRLAQPWLTRAANAIVLPAELRAIPATRRGRDQ